MKFTELDNLIEDCLEGRLSESDAARLNAQLEQSAEARARYWETASIHGLLEHMMQVASLRVVTGQALPTIPRINRWFAWSPLTAAAAGLVLGLFCTSVVFAYVAPSLGKVISLLQESFEFGPAPLVLGVPIETGKWSGDFSEVAGEQQGVKAKTGAKMLRFLRADYEGKTKHEGNYYADVYRLIDVRPHRRDLAAGGAAVCLSAAFNAFAFPQEEGFWCSVAIHALGSPSPGDHDQGREWAIYSNSLAMVRDRRMKLDRDPATWQRVDAELRLPPDTEFLLIRLSVDHAHPSQRRATFDGHYLDDVRLSLVRRSPLR